jgi:hypothetical protein
MFNKFHRRMRWLQNSTAGCGGYKIPPQDAVVTIGKLLLFFHLKNKKLW